MTSESEVKTIFNSHWHQEIFPSKQTTLFDFTGLVKVFKRYLEASKVMAS